MIFRVKINKKIKEWVDIVKKYIIYMFERVDREKDENRLTLLFDCTDAGISNVDIDLLFFILSLVRNYYPMILNGALVYQLPWILNYVLKLVYSWLPQDHREMIHLITKKELFDNIASDELPDFLGGTCDLPYKTAPIGVLSAHDLAEQLSISKSAADKLTKHLEPYIMSNDLVIK